MKRLWYQRAISIFTAMAMAVTPVFAEEFVKESTKETKVDVEKISEETEQKTTETEQKQREPEQKTTETKEIEAETVQKQTASVYAPNVALLGTAIVTKSSTVYNINPYNPATITGVGEGTSIRLESQEGTFFVPSYSLRLLTQEGTLELPLSRPLYGISEAYTDRIVCRNGIWGVERNVGLKVFDGTEEWHSVESRTFLNKNTTVLSCDAPEKVLVRSGLSTHFDVYQIGALETTGYDGIAFDKATEQIYMRSMNVKNMSTPETRNAYLKAQYDAGTPMKFLYALPETVFEPFSEELQEKLNSVNWETVGFLDKNLRIGKAEARKLDTSVFQKESTGSAVADQVLSSVTEVKIYGEPTGDTYYIYSIMAGDNALGITVKNTAGHSFYGEVSYLAYDFLAEKPVEILLHPQKETPEAAIIEMKLNLSALKAPTESIFQMDSQTAPLQESCIQQKGLVMTKYTPLVEGLSLEQYPANALLNGSTAKEDSITREDNGIWVDTRDGVALNDVSSPIRYRLNGDESTEVSMEVRKVPKEAGAGQQQTILFLGDSLINENTYTKSVQALFADDPMQVTLIGTRGEEGNAHEGRGGWSAYDYCTVSEKYGFTNPFLHNGTFDFGYYMETAGYEGVDTVVVSLGVNDLNLVGHNSHEEIIGYFNTIFDSIHAYNPEVNIILNTPTMLFSTEGTDGAKNTRLEFTKTLQEVYGDKETEGIYLSNISMYIDPAMNFKWVESVDKSKPMTVSDTTHPNVKGYQNMAVATYSFLKYLAE